MLCRVLEKFSTGIFGHALVHMKVAVGTCALGMNDTLRDSFPVEMCKFFNKVDVLKQHGSSLANRQ